MENFCDSRKCVENFCNSTLTPNGKVIICYFNLDKLPTKTSQNIHTLNHKLTLQDYSKYSYEELDEYDLWCDSLDNLLEKSTKVNKVKNLDKYELPSYNIINEDEVDEITSAMENISVTTSAATLMESTGETSAKSTSETPVKSTSETTMKKNIESFVKYHTLCDNYDNFRFKSRKLLSKNQTKLFSVLLSVDFELLSNAYDATFDYLSIYHDVDKLFGSVDH